MNGFVTRPDALCIRNPSNLFYYTNYKNADAKILFIGEKKYYFTDARYFEEISDFSDFEIKNIEEFLTFLAENNIKTLGTDVLPTIKEYEILQKHGVTAVVDAESEINEKRAKKTSEEIGFIQKAQEITDRTFTEILGKIQEGMTERHLERILKSTMYLWGADDLAFDPIVAFGKNTSKPHAHPTDTPLTRGSFITLDFGAKYRNYCSDMTRTVAFGKPSDEMKKTYELVLEAQKKALDALHAGMSGKECDKLARDVFRRENKENFFTHSLGHSLGIDIHEKPNLSPKSDEIIGENAVTSVEPGLYFPGKFGVRIEDIVVFTKNGVNNLTNSEKSLIIL